MWTKIDGPRVQKATPKLVKEWVDMESFPHDRPLKEELRDSYRACVKAGTFRTCEWVYAYCASNDTTYRINGKHTSQAFSLEPEALAKHPVSVVISGFECPTMQDVADLYATFDRKAGVRSARDIYFIYAASCSALSECGARFIQLAAPALGYALWERGYLRRPAEDRAQLLIQHADFVNWLHTLVGGSFDDYPHFYRVPVAAAMATTFWKDRKDAMTFWSYVKDGSGTNHKAPDRTLHDYLLTIQRRGRGASRLPDREIFVKCLHAWNASRQGETTKLNYYADKPIPKVA